MQKMSEQKKSGKKIFLWVLAALLLIALIAAGIFYLRISSPAALFEPEPTPVPTPEAIAPTPTPTPVQPSAAPDNTPEPTPEPTPTPMSETELESL